LHHFQDFFFFHLNVPRNLNKERWLLCFQQNCWWCLAIRWKRFWIRITYYNDMYLPPFQRKNGSST
jgi:hypothetical protein